jgi:hypothetical protein
VTPSDGCVIVVAVLCVEARVESCESETKVEVENVASRWELQIQGINGTTFFVTPSLARSRVK